ncbi:MAG: beta-ketoacyl-[Lachnospiraceae bacterium]|nr:beta-ketoacyl-[acyl-carrier-protein] synthase family protein [Lachnospiraceae bacterium]
GITTICETQETFTLAEKKAVGPRFVPRVIGNMAAAQIAIPYGIRGPSVTISTACASGGDAIRYAALLLETGEADAVLTLGSESTLTPIVFYSLASAQALSKRNDEPEKACRPFDEDHSGFVMGEGGGALVLETETHAKARGAQIYAELAGWAATSDAWHVTAPHPEGEGAIRCLRLALEKAGTDPSEIGYLNAHGTGTKSGDAAEALVIREVFGMDGGAKGPAVSSTKASTGHLMGAGGITDAIACIQALRTGLLPATISLETPAYDLDLVTGGPRRAEITAAMTNALGFGGQNSSLVFRKYH